MTISRRARLMIVSAGVLCGLLVVRTNARGATGETPAANPACAGIEKNAALSIAASTRSVSITLVNRDKATLWVPEKAGVSSLDSEARLATIWYGYFPERYGQLSLDYVIQPMRKVAPKQTSRWTFIPSQDRLINKLVPGYLFKVRMRVALKAFASEGRAGMKRLNALLADSCVIEASARVPSK